MRSVVFALNLGHVVVKPGTIILSTAALDRNLGFFTLTGNNIIRVCTRLRAQYSFSFVIFYLSPVGLSVRFLYADSPGEGRV